MASESIGPVIITAATGAFLTLLTYLGTRNNQKEATVKDLYVDEKKARIECEQRERTAEMRFHAALELIESERDEHKQRADILEVRIEQMERPGIGGSERRPERRRRRPEER